MAGPGRKRRFLLCGAVNVLITNLALQGLLLVASTGFATFLSQLLNVSIGFVLYGKGVFRVDRLQRRSAFAYGLLALLLWWGNWAGISVLVGLGCARHLAALLLVPALAVLSYAAQKLVVFRSNPSAGMLN